MTDFLMQKSPSKLRDTGLEVLGDRPWGTHFCIFFDTKSDLLEILRAYFKAGLENNEFCLWVLSHPLTEADARQALISAVPSWDRSVLDRQVEIVPHDDIYLAGGSFDLQRVTHEWHARLDRALAAGYDGVRITGGSGWQEIQQYSDFFKYEAALGDSIGGERMTVLCSYSLPGSKGSDVLDVAHVHQTAITKRDGDWEVVETAALRAAKEEIRKLNEELEQRVADRTREWGGAQAELARVERLTTLGEFAASITHEFLQPVAAMMVHGKACLNVLERKPPDLEQARAAARSIVSEGTRATELFRSLRALISEAAPRVARLDVNSVIREVLALLRGELLQHQITVRIELQDSLPAILADRVQLQQVLFNLIRNAIQAMSQVQDRVRQLTVRSESQPQAESILITVEDSGTGLRADDIERIFESMFTTKTEGMGMGLAIARSIITAHGGRLWALPGKEFGAVFQLSLPVTPAIEGAGA